MLLLIKVGIYIALILSLLIFPMIGSFILGFWIKNKSGKIFASLLLFQFITLSFLYFKPIVTYDSKVEHKEVNMVLTVFHFRTGFYFPRLPVIAYRFHVLEQNEEHIKARIDYFPFGEIIQGYQKGDGYYMVKSFFN